MFRRLFPSVAIAFERMTLLDYFMLPIALCWVIAPVSQLVRMALQAYGVIGGDQ